MRKEKHEQDKHEYKGDERPKTRTRQAHQTRAFPTGQGKIGKEPFRHIVNDPRFELHPGCLETPKSKDLHEDLENLAILRALVRRSITKDPRKVQSAEKTRAK